MPRRCERPGCSASAAVAYGFEAERSHVWLEAVTEDAAATVNAGVLCRRHADALRPPLGWFLDDRRELTPRLFRPPDEAAPAPKIRRERRAKSVDTTEELPFGPFVDVPAVSASDRTAWSVSSTLRVRAARSVVNPVAGSVAAAATDAASSATSRASR